MTEQEVQAFCANNGISVSPPGAPLFVVDPENLPPKVRKFVNDDGTYAGDGKQSNDEVGEVPNANPTLDTQAEKAGE